MNYLPPPRWAHQQRAIDVMAGRQAFALFMEMRTGKTKVVLDEWSDLVAKGEVSQLLVIAPAGVYRTWETAAQTHLDPDLMRRSAVLAWSASDSQKAAGKLKILLGRSGPKILLVNVEALSRVERAKALCLSFAQAAPTMVVI